MADSYLKKEREKKRRKRKTDKLDKKKQKKAEGIKPPEFMYLDKDGNFSPTPIPESEKEEVDLADILISTPKKTDSDESDFIKQGVVKFYNQEKCFGFIKEANSNDDYFAHADNIVDTIKERDKVTFEATTGPKGLVAINVRLLKDEPKKPKVVKEPIVAADTEKAKVESIDSSEATPPPTTS